MLGSDVLEAALGLAFTFALLGLVASAIRESIEALAQTRAIGLERGLRALLDDPDGQGVTRALYAHPLIAGLFRGRYAPEALRGAGAGRRLKLGSRLPAYLPARNVALALLDLAETGGPALRTALTIASEDARGDATRTIANVEHWFDSAMERVGGWYRKQTHGLLLAIGLMLAVALNVDALALARTLYREPATRAAIVADAQARPCADAECAETRLDALALPIGWNATSDARWWRSVPGWLLTAFAVSLGAPFWFDLLGRVVSVRSTVRPGAAPPKPVEAETAPPPHQWAGRADPHEGLL